MNENYNIKNSLNLFFVLLFTLLIGTLSSIDRINIMLFFVVTFTLLLILIIIKQKSINLILLHGLFIFVAIENNYIIFGIGIIHIYMILILIMYFLSCYRVKTFSLKENDLQLYYLVAMYMFFSSVGYITMEGVSPINGFIKAFKIIILPTFIVFYLFHEIKTKEVLEKVIKTLIITSTIFSIIGIVQYLSDGLMLSGLLTNHRYLGLFNKMDLYINNSDIQHIRSFVPDTNTFRLHGSFYAHNSFAGFVGSVAPLTLIFILKKDINRVLFTIFLIIQTIAVYLTFSRTGLLTLIVAYLIVFIFYNRHLKIVGIVIKGIGLFLFTFVGLALYLFMGFGESDLRFLNFNLGNISEFSDRVKIWEITIIQSKGNLWFGNGLDFLDKNLTSFLIYNDVSPHNVFLHILYSSGLISLLLIIILLIIQVIKFFKVLNLELEQSDQIILIALFSSMISFIGSGITESLFINLNLKMLFWIILSLFFIYYKIATKQEGTGNDV
ncbi:O-antigen ligase family protein [Fredinandcohnia humi]